MTTTPHHQHRSTCFWDLHQCRWQCPTGPAGPRRSPDGGGVRPLVAAAPSPPGGRYGDDGC